MKLFDKAIIDCESCLKIEPNNQKALLHKAQALVSQHHLDEVQLFKLFSLIVLTTKSLYSRPTFCTKKSWMWIL